MLLLLLLGVALLLLSRCGSDQPRPGPTAAPAEDARAVVPPAPAETPETEEKLGPASLSLEPDVQAGGGFDVRWTGPDNEPDFITVVPPDAPDGTYESYADTRKGAVARLTASMDPGTYEVRYVAGKSKTVLARAPVRVLPVGASVSAPDSAVLGSELSVTWTGPDNKGDFITIVPKSLPDGQHQHYAMTEAGSPASLRVPVDVGDAEIRYVSGQGRQVLARRGLQVVAPEIRLEAPGSVLAGAPVEVVWTGPANRGDYITIVATGTPDGQYANHSETSRGSPLTLTAPIDPGDAEIRYMTGEGARVLGRRSLRVTAAEVSLSAPDEAVVGSSVTIAWKGPDNRGDYITVVPKDLPDGQYGNHNETVRGSPLTVAAPIDAGPAEIRYMSGQGARVLARRPLRLLAATVTLDAPEEVSAGEKLTVTWTGPDNRGDYITIVPESAPEGTYASYADTHHGSPSQLSTPKEAGACEIRYVSGQGRRILGRKKIVVR